MAYDMFISYKQEGDLGKTAAALARQCGWTPFLAENSLEYGSDYKKQIIAAVQETPVFIFLATKDSCRSVACHHEIGIALGNHQKGKTLVVPVMMGNIAPADLPPWIANHQGQCHVKSGMDLLDVFTKLRDRYNKKTSDDAWGMAALVGLGVLGAWALSKTK